MLQLYDINKNKIKGLTEYKDLKIEREINVDNTLSFLCPKNEEIQEECYIRTKENEYVVKEINIRDDWNEIVCRVNLETIKGKNVGHYEAIEQTCNNSVNLALVGTGWMVGGCDVTKKRTTRKKNCTSYEILKEIQTAYLCEMVFDAINKKVYIYQKLGEDKGVYFSEQLNLKNLNVQRSSYAYVTRIIPIGKDGLKINSINNGKEYIENYKYSTKILATYWEDNRYTNVQSLLEDATARLNILSVPLTSYSTDIIDLAKISDEYKNILDYKLGDTITLLSKNKNIREKQRIVKLTEYPDQPELNNCEIANKIARLEDITERFEDTSNIIESITTTEGLVDGTKIDGLEWVKIKNVSIETANITDLSVVTARIGTLEATTATITDLTVINGNITNLQVDKANITDLKATNAKINVLEADTGNIKTLLAGNLTSTNIQAGGVTSDKLTISNGFITNAMIGNLDVSKINAGIINTNKFVVKSDDGGIELSGSTQQFKDKNNKVRIQMGKDSKGDFNFILRGEDGATILIDHTGIKKNAIANDLIVKEMIGAKAVGEKQLDYTSFSEGFNKDTNTTTLKATKIKLDNQNQTLDVAFNGLKSQADGTKNLTDSHSTTIGIQQGQINTAINNSQIIKDGQTILLKDDYNRTVVTVDSINTTIGKHQSTLDANTKDIVSVTTNVTEVKKSLDGITARVGSSESNITTVTSIANSALTNANKGVNDASTAKARADLGVTNAELAQTQANKGVADALLASNKAGQSLIDAKTYTNSQISTVNTNVSNANSEINILKGKIDLKVEQSNINTAVSNIVVGGRNLILDSQNIQTTPNNAGLGIAIKMTNETIPYWRVTAITTVSTYESPIWAYMSANCIVGKAYTISCDVRIPANGSVGFYAGLGTNTGIVANVWTRISYTFTYSTYRAGGHTYSGTQLDYRNWKLEIGTKNSDYTPAPEDIDKSISDTIIINETKINQAKAEILVETNSIKQSVSSVDSKVTTMTTTANNALTNANTAQTQANLGVTNAKGALDKANNVDGKVTTLTNTVTNTNTKVATIETNLNGITSRVSAEEKKSTAIDGKVIAQETRLTSAESKITASAIISTVQATITTAKTDAINSANATTAAKLNAYSNTNQMTTAITQSANSVKTEISNTYITTGNANNSFATKSSVAQTDLEWRATFKSSGGMNLLTNSGFKNGFWNWIKTTANSNGTGVFYEVWPDSSIYCPNGKQVAVLRATNNTTGEIRLDSSKFKVKQHTWYTVSYLVAAHRCSEVGSYIRGNSWDIINSTRSLPKTGGKDGTNWTKHAYNFNSGDNDQANINLILFKAENDGYAWFTDVIVTEGTTEVPWSPHPSELYEGSTCIDATGVTIYNGAIKVLDSAGNEVLKGDSSGISFSGRLQPRDNTIRLFGENCKLEGGYGGLRRSVGNTYDSVTDGGSWVLFNPHSQNGTRYAGITVDRESHVQLFSQSTMLKLLNGGTPSVQARWAGDGGYCMMQASSFTVSSREEFKENIQAPDNIDFQKILMENTIKSYNYKQDLAQIEKIPTVMLPDGTNPIKPDIKIGLVIEELSEEAVSLFNPTGSDGVDLYSMCSVLWKVNQEQEERIVKLEQLLNV
ncbi:phage tail protein [Clostridium gasigenes]|uniref:phage tail spike protein n=1 Tax=Clostridium gasigenes TaxID=94869 RepID=UPI001438552E|nr:phage tail spike protein [Clostridium gasigenes]NKF05307.1 hypothetical protein [Clostridium gasigenes]QSW18761.1 phage tail protein [Clostridium gasigenes]